MPLHIIESISRLCAASDGMARRRPETIAEVAKIYLLDICTDTPYRYNLSKIPNYEQLRKT